MIYILQPTVFTSSSFFVAVSHRLVATSFSIEKLPSEEDNSASQAENGQPQQESCFLAELLSPLLSASSD